MRLPTLRPRLLPTAALLLLAVQAVSAQTVTGRETGLSAHLSSSGTFTVSSGPLSWSIAGTFGEALQGIEPDGGEDGLGSYAQLRFRYREGTPRAGAIRVYHERPMVVFECEFLAAGFWRASCPSVTSLPTGLQQLTWAGVFGQYRWNQSSPDSPYLLFDEQGRSLVLSAAQNLLLADLSRDARGTLRSDLLAPARSVPAGFRHRTLLAFGQGMGATLDAWGDALRALGGSPKPSASADLLLSHIGYWTDAGSNYYYEHEHDKTYEGTLLAVRDAFRRAGVQPGYLQLDSWWYPKGPSYDWRDRSRGIQEYVADASLFAGGLRDFRERLGLPLAVHARWIDTGSPYRDQYRVSGNVIVDPLYWQSVARYLRESGVTVFEQDWLSDRAQPDYTLRDAPAFFDGMAAGMAAEGLTMQYCMPLPRHFLQATRYANVTTIRTSQDRFGRDRWDEFLYGSRLAASLGLWPFTDVFMSPETDNLVLAAFSAGPVGVGDALWQFDGDNLRRVARPDGVLVKPDVPLVPTDATLLADARGHGLTPMVAATHTEHAAGRTGYVVAYPRGAQERPEVDIRPGLLGVRGDAWIVNGQTGEAILVPEGSTFRAPLPGLSRFLVAPVGPSGVSVWGDSGHFVSMGRQRVSAHADDGTVRLTIQFAPGEGERVLDGASVVEPQVVATHGQARLLSWDPETRRFRMAVSAGAEGTAKLEVEVRSCQACGELPSPSERPRRPRAQAPHPEGPRK